MRERDTLHCQAPVLKDDLMLRSVNSMKLNTILKSITEKVHLRVKQRLEGFRRIDMQRSGAAKHAKGRDETDETEAMVTMEMRDEDGLDLRKADMRAPQLDLRSLTAVDHEELSPDLYDLRGREMFQGGQRAAAP